MNQRKLVHEELTYLIRGVIFDVYNTLGFGLHEHVYRNAIAKRCQQRGLEVQQEVGVEVMFLGEKIADFRLDLLVEKVIVLELKSVSELAPEHKAQLIGHLVATRRELGLLVNLGSQKLRIEAVRNVLVEDGFERPRLSDNLPPVIPSELRRLLTDAANTILDGLGPGYQKPVYRSAMRVFCHQSKIPFQEDTYLDAYFEGEKIGQQPVDAVIGKETILLVQANATFDKSSLTLAHNYIKLTGLPRAVVMNFGTRKVSIEAAVL